MTVKKLSGVKRLLPATRYALQGLKTAFKEEAAFRQELLLALILLPLSFWIAEDIVSYILLMGSVVLVLITELINSAIENTVNRISHNLHSLSKNAKDLASAAVFLAIVFCASIWITFFIAKFDHC